MNEGEGWRHPPAPTRSMGTPTGLSFLQPPRAAPSDTSHGCCWAPCPGPRLCFQERVGAFVSAGCALAPAARGAQAAGDVCASRCSWASPVHPLRAHLPAPSLQDGLCLCPAAWLGMPGIIPVCHSELGAGAAPTWLRNPNKLSRLGTRAGTSSVLTLNSYWCDSLAIYLFKATELFAILLKSKHSVWAGELFCLNVRLGDTDDNLSE